VVLELVSITCKAFRGEGGTLHCFNSLCLFTRKTYGTMNDYDVPDYGSHEYLRCEGCGHYFHPTDLTEIDENNYCEICEKQLEDENEVL
jgi:hypothetical protein